MGLGGICGADVGLLWGGCGLAMGLGVGIAGILWGWRKFYSSGGRGPLKSVGRPDGRRAAVGLGRVCGAGRGLWSRAGAAMGWLWACYGAGCGPGGILWGWGEFYSSGGRGPLKSMGRPDGHRALVGLGGIYGADVGLLWGGCGLAMGLGVGPGGILWGWVGFCSSGGRGSLKSMGRPDGRRAAVGLRRICGAGRDLWG